MGIQKKICFKILFIYLIHLGFLLWKMKLIMASHSLGCSWELCEDKIPIKPLEHAWHSLLSAHSYGLSWTLPHSVSSNLPHSGQAHRNIHGADETWQKLEGKRWALSWILSGRKGSGELGHRVFHLPKKDCANVLGIVTTQVCFKNKRGSSPIHTCSSAIRSVLLIVLSIASCHLLPRHPIISSVGTSQILPMDLNVYL